MQSHGPRPQMADPHWASPVHDFTVYALGMNPPI